MITAAQLRAGRALLGITQKELAAEAGVAEATIARLERMSGKLRVLVDTAEKIETALRSRGVDFIENGVFLKD